MRKWMGLIAFVALAALFPWTSAEASGGGATAPPPASAGPSVQKSPQAVAEDAYNQGLKIRDKAWKLEEKAEAAGSDAERAKLLAKAEKQYAKSIPLFLNATERVSTFHQALSELGYAYRKTGQYEKSLKAYDRALEISPYYGQAIEYRGEAYLGLNRIEEAKEAYLSLFARDRVLADQLMEAMQKWLDARRADSAGVSSEELAGFESWVQERGEIAEQTAQLFEASERTWGD